MAGGQDEDAAALDHPHMGHFTASTASKLRHQLLTIISIDRQILLRTASHKLSFKGKRVLGRPLLHHEASVPIFLDMCEMVFGDQEFLAPCVNSDVEKVALGGLDCEREIVGGQ